MRGLLKRLAVKRWDKYRYGVKRLLAVVYIGMCFSSYF